MQKRPLYLLKTVSVFTIAHYFAPGVIAQERVSLEQAINSYLDNSCAGLLNASVDANGNLLENNNFSIVTDSLTRVGDARVSNFGLINPPDETGTDARTNFAYNATLPAIRATSSTVSTANGQQISFEVQTAYGGDYTDTSLSFDSFEQEERFYRELNEQTGIELDSFGGSISDDEFFVVSDFVDAFNLENGTSLDLNDRFEHGYENRIEFEQNGIAVSEILNGSDFDFATGIATIEQDYVASVSKRLNSELFGAGLVGLCEQEGITQSGTFIAEDFQFGVSVQSDLFGGIRGSSNGSSSSLGSAGLSGLTQSASGATAVRAQEDVRRRENDVVSFIERLRRKFKREKETETYKVASAGEFGAYQAPSSKYSFVFDALGGSIRSIDQPPISRMGSTQTVCL